MSAGPIYYFTDEHAWASNFDNGHEIALNPDCNCVVYPLWLTDEKFFSAAEKAGLPIRDDSVMVTGVERPFQAFKTDDLEVAIKILSAPTPGVSKRMGQPPAKRGLVADLRSGWDPGRGARGLCHDAMYWLTQAKYSVGMYTMKLSQTGYRMMVEGNKHGDTRWGAIWMTQQDANAQGLPVWGRRSILENAEVLAGWNWLGRLLMLVRSEIDCQVEWE